MTRPSRKECRIERNGEEETKVQRKRQRREVLDGQERK
jgi:hypothetical protein